jgi:hypothetical protein
VDRFGLQKLGAQVRGRMALTAPLIDPKESQLQEHTIYKLAENETVPFQFSRKLSRRSLRLIALTATSPSVHHSSGYLQMESFLQSVQTRDDAETMPGMLRRIDAKLVVVVIKYPENIVPTGKLVDRISPIVSDPVYAFIFAC